MCLPVKNDQSDSPGPGTRSILGLGALMLVACLAGPALAGAIGALGLGVLVGAGGAVLALALCAAVPAIGITPFRESFPDVRMEIGVSTRSTSSAFAMGASARRGESRTNAPANDSSASPIS